MDETLIAGCHRAMLEVQVSHPSPAGYELLVHPALRAAVERFEEEARLRPGSFATLVGARRVIFTLGAGESFAVFCLKHVHRLELLVGAAVASDADSSGTITS